MDEKYKFGQVGFGQVGFGQVGFGQVGFGQVSTNGVLSIAIEVNQWIERSDEKGLKVLLLIWSAFGLVESLTQNDGLIADTKKKW